MTIQEAMAYCRDQLKPIYEEGETAIISDWVVENVSGIKKTDRLNQQKKLMTADQVSLMQTYLQKLLKHEPIQYVLHEAWFCGLKIYVDKNVLIPRPETEELVEWIITDCKFPVNRLKILDIGTGSGCIPIALKRRLGKAEVWSCDTSKEALEVAMRNAVNLGADVNFIQADFLSPTERDAMPSFDIVISNPPYVPEKDKTGIRPNVLRYEPHIALFVPDNDPLVFYKAIAGFGKNHLNEGGMIYVEIHEDYGTGVVELFRQNGYQSELKKDMQGKNRMLKAILTGRKM